MLIVQRDRLFMLFPGILSFSEEMVVEPATFFKDTLQTGYLLFGGVDSVFEGLTHGF